MDPAPAMPTRIGAFGSSMPSSLSEEPPKVTGADEDDSGAWQNCQRWRESRGHGGFCIDPGAPAEPRPRHARVERKASNCAQQLVTTTCRTSGRSPRRPGSRSRRPRTHTFAPTPHSTSSLGSARRATRSSTRRGSSSKACSSTSTAAGSRWPAERGSGTSSCR